MSASAEKFVSLTEKQRAHFTWLEAPYLKRVIAALEAVEPDAARYVGGCVRDSLLGHEPKDFDVATALEPDVVMAALKKANLGAAPTGIDHGTITAIADHQGVEVTTLRADVSTDGRRATVAFTRDWAIDASRRDFRINAVYLTPDGRLFNPVGGVEDAREKQVRFIGKAEQRIREDYLRILRFFRFTARFSKSFDPAGLAACASLKAGIGQLSAERVGAEFMTILALPCAVFALKAMQDSGVLKEIWPAEADIEAADRLKTIDALASSPLMLAVLYGEDGGGVGQRLRLSNAGKAVRTHALKAMTEISSELSDQEIRALIYRLGKDVFTAAAAAAGAFQKIDEVAYRRLKTIADQWAPPVFSISGKDIVAAGIAPGPDIAAILKAVETQWIAENFPPGGRAKEILSEQLKIRNS